MKKYIYLCIMFFFLFAPNVKALNGICMIDSRYSTIEQGNEITVDFYIHDINDLEINSGYLELQYDTNIFDFIRIESLYDGFNSDVINNDGLLKLSLNSDGHISNINSNVILASIRFRVKNDAGNGSTRIIMIGEDVSYVGDSTGGNNSCLATGNKSLDYNVYNINNEAILSSLSVSNGNLSPKFNSNITDYSISVSNNIDNIIINSSCSVNGCRIEGNGKKNLSIGKNVFNIVAISPNGNIRKTYSIIVNRTKKEINNVLEQKKEIVKDSNANLKSLSVSVGELDPIFVPEVTEYEVLVDSDINKIRINAICSGIECTVKGTGNKYLEYGDNEYKIEVVAEDGTEKIYTVKVLRSYDLRLNSLIINNYKLNPNFDKDIYNYHINVESDVNKLNIIAQSIDENAKINIIGNDNFSEGRNVVKIEISNANDDVKTYTIIVNKNNNEIKVINNDKSIWDNSYVIVGGIICGILLFGLIIGIIWYLLKKKNKNN